MRLTAKIKEIKKKASTVSIFIRIENAIVTEIRMSNFYLVRKWNHFIGQVNIEFFFKLPN